MVDLLFTPAPRRRDAYVEADARQSFKRIIARATRGTLVPIDHVKEIERAGRASVNMFELRWNDIELKEDDPAGSRGGRRPSLRCRRGYVRQALHDATAKTFKAPIVMPIMRRGDLAFSFEDLDRADED